MRSSSTECRTCGKMFDAKNSSRVAKLCLECCIESDRIAWQQREPPADGRSSVSRPATRQTLGQAIVSVLLRAVAGALILGAVVALALVAAFFGGGSTLSSLIAVLVVCCILLAFWVLLPLVAYVVTSQLGRRNSELPPTS